MPKGKCGFGNGFGFLEGTGVIVGSGVSVIASASMEGATVANKVNISYSDSHKVSFEYDT